MNTNRRTFITAAIAAGLLPRSASAQPDPDALARVRSMSPRERAELEEKLAAFRKLPRRSARGSSTQPAASRSCLLRRSRRSAPPTSDFAGWPPGSAPECARITSGSARCRRRSVSSSEPRCVGSDS